MVTLGELWVSKSQYLALSQLRSPSCDFWHSNNSSSAAPMNFKGQIDRRHTAKIQNIHQRMHKYASSILKPFKAAELAGSWYRVYLVRGRIAPQPCYLVPPRGHLCQLLRAVVISTGCQILIHQTRAKLEPELTATFIINLTLATELCTEVKGRAQVILFIFF